MAEGKGKGWGVGPAAAVGGGEGRAASHRLASNQPLVDEHNDYGRKNILL